MLEVPDFSISVDNTVHLTDMRLALSADPITDYSSIPIWRYTDWQFLLKMNDRPGTYHNMLSAEQRQKLIMHIRKFKTAHK